MWCGVVWGGVVCGVVWCGVGSDVSRLREIGEAEVFGAALSITMIDAERRTERRTGFVRGFDFYRDDQDYAVEVSPGGRRREEGGSILALSQLTVQYSGPACPVRL